MLTEAQKSFFEQNGYLLMPQLFSAAEAADYRDHYMEMSARQQGNADRGIAAPQSADPLLRYPRLMQMHRHDEVSLGYMLDPRLRECLTGLLGEAPYAVQTMHYFKPAGARGQGLHQDNYYLRVQPGTCIAAWMALDPCNEENGCLQVVPGSHDWPILCTVPGDTSESFTDVVVPLPEGVTAQPVLMEPGDVLFFNGQIVHGSFPNRSKDRFRRSLVAHYIQGNSRQVAHWYHPALRMDGTPVELETSPGGSRCGTWVSENGKPVIELTGYEDVTRASE